jgi:hypothetical protein
MRTRTRTKSTTVLWKGREKGMDRWMDSVCVDAWHGDTSWRGRRDLGKGMGMEWECDGHMEMVLAADFSKVRMLGITMAWEQVCREVADGELASGTRQDYNEGPRGSYDDFGHQYIKAVGRYEAWLRLELGQRDG